MTGPQLQLSVLPCTRPVSTDPNRLHCSRDRPVEREDAVQATSADLKSKYGLLAYVIQTAQVASEFTGIELTASTVEDGRRETVWEGEAAFVLAGNGSRFTRSGSRQADIEDGRLDVTIIEDVGSVGLVKEHLLERLLDHGSEHVTRLLASSPELEVGDDSVSFSLDGETVHTRTMELTTRTRSLRMAVGDGYDPTPEAK